MTILAALLGDQSGAQLFEYELLASLIALVALASVAAFGHNISSLFGPAARSTHPCADFC